MSTPPATRRGARVVCIDPRRADTAGKCHLHFAPWPGTALALAMVRMLIAEGLDDQNYIARHTPGFAALPERMW